MRTGFAKVLAGVAGVAMGLVMVLADAAAAELTLKRVLLSTGGVGYFEHEAVIDGNATLELEVRLDQVDDVLKSIVVFDDRGGVGAISLPGREPLAQVFRDLPFGPEALVSRAALLNALRGARVRVAGDRLIEGRLLAVEPEVTRLPGDGGTITRHRVSLMAVSGLRQFILEDAETLEFIDPALGAQVEQALAAIAAHRARDKRRLSIEMLGAGRRTVRVAYVVATPLWKATYRLILSPEGGEPSALLQGWAVIENMSGMAWDGVELTLASGNPVTFRQALYTAYYVDRPEVPVEVLGRVLPPPDTGVIGGLMRGEQAAGLQKKEREARAAMDALSKMAAEPLADMAFAEMAAAGAAAPAPTPMSLALNNAAESEETATQVVFRVPQPVSVASGHSLIVAIVNDTVPARRFAHFQPRTHARHPLASVRLANDTESGLPPGVLTLYERSAKTGAVAYVGDARLATLPAGEDRLVGFALDQKTRIERDVKTKRSIFGGSISRGVFALTRIERQTTIYRLKAPAREARAVLIDHPRHADWKLIEPADDDVDLIDGGYRFEVAIEAGAEAVFEVTVERPVTQSLGITSLTLGQIVRFAGTGEFDAKVREAFERLAELKREVVRHEQRMAELERARQIIYQEQSRIRDNLGRIPSGSDLHRRYLRKLDAQEDKLETIVEAFDQAQRRQIEANRKLDDYIKTLKI